MVFNTSTVLRHDQVRLLAAIFLAASMWFYVEHILIPYQAMEARANDRPRGNLSDLYPRWLGARELLLHHRDPYSAEVTREVQEGYYGRGLDSARPGDPKDQQAFAYPVFVVFLLKPFVSLPFEVVRPAFTWLLVLLTAASVPLWFYVLRWRLSLIAQVTIVILTLGSFQVAQGLKLQQLTLVVSALMAAAVALICAGHLVTAGGFLAIALMKPQLVLPLLGWLLLWTTGDLRHRWRLVIGFGITSAILLAGSQAILPGWIGKFRHAVLAYRDYTGGGHDLLEMLLGATAGHLLDGIVIALCVLLAWRNRQAAAGAPEFFHVTALVLAVTVAIVPMVALYNQVLLLPSLIMLIRDREDLPRGITRLIAQLTLLWGVWPWVATVMLAVAASIVPKTILLKCALLPMYNMPGFPVLLTALLLLRMWGLRRRPEPL